MKLFAGLVKLVQDTARFEGGAREDIAELRRALFVDAARARREGRFDRARLVRAAAERAGLDEAALERELYGDLRGAELLRELAPEAPEALVARWERAQVQAVLLRATKVEIELSADPADARALFRRLKFHRLLWRVERADEAAWRVTVDGPMSLFGSSTKYGMELALLLPALEATRSYRLRCELAWGKERARASFTHEGGGADLRSPVDALPEETAALVEKLPQHGWRARVADELLDLPGVGIIVPDLTLDRADGARVFVEVLGHWSRAAVWRRVEMVEAKLGAPIVFCVSERLRVSEEALPDGAPSCLYVYKGVMSAKAIAERAERIAPR